MLVNGTPTRTVWMEGRTVKMIDQRLLPHRVEILDCADHRATAEAIRNMTVRGAGAIGAAAGYAMAQGVVEAPDEPAQFWPAVETAAARIRGTRPTAHDLFFAVDRVLAAAQSAGAPARRAKPR